MSLSEGLFKNMYTCLYMVFLLVVTGHFPGTLGIVSTTL